MFGPIGGPELLLILVIALIVFGPRKLPEIGKSMGKMMAEFRRASNEFKRTIEDEVEAEKHSPPPPTSTPAPPATEVPGSDAPVPPVEAAPPAAEPEMTAPSPPAEATVHREATPPASTEPHH